VVGALLNRPGALQHRDGPARLRRAASVQITATDISREVLGRGRAGRYSEINRGLPAAMLVRHFARAGTGWELSAAMRSRVTFTQHNLLDPPPAGGPFDIIFGRNVLICFDLATRRAVLGRVSAVPAPRGFVLPGATESTLGIQDA
jgi:chemotaxis protein methyltransferase CheR